MAAPPSTVPPQATTEILPSPVTLMQAAKLAIAQDKSIQLDYFVDTYNQRAFLLEDSEAPADSKEKDRVLYKTRDEFTSNVKHLYKVATDIIVVTENSIYIVSGKIQKRGAKLAVLRNADDFNEA